MNVTDVEVIVIGAGISGLAAASRLVENGFEKVLILEAEERIGGRVNTVQFGDSKVDLGGHWVGGEEGNPIFDLVKDLDVLTKTDDFTKIHFHLENGCRIDQNDVDQLFASISNVSNDIESLKNFKGSLYDYYDHRLSPVLNSVCSENWFGPAFLNWLDHFSSFEKGCDTIKNASLSSLYQRKACPGHQTLVWKQGFSSIVDILMKKHRNDESKRLKEDNINLKREVTNINWSGEKLTVSCSNGEVYSCDHVIVTVSVGVIKEKLHTLFKPTLPILYQDAFNSLDMGAVEKIYLKYDTQWWPDDCSGFCFISKDQDSWENKIAGFFTQYGNPNILCAWIAGEAAVAMELSSDEDIMKTCSKILKNYLGDKYDVKEPSRIMRSKWFSNSNFRGATSFRTLKCDDLNANTSILSKPIINHDKPVIIFAGEATSEHFFSTTHGALESGWRAAHDLIDFYHM